MLLTKILDNESVEEKLFIFFSKIKFGRFLSDPNLKYEDALNFEIKNFLDYNIKANINFLIENNEILGLIGFKESEWDSSHFGYKVAKIDYFLINENNISAKKGALILIKSFHTWVDANDIKVAITKIDSTYFDVSEVLQKENYIFYECITYRNLRNPKSLVGTLDNLNYRFASLNDFSQIKSIAESNTFEKSHFFLDTKFSKDKVNAMYVKWIKNALHPQSNDKVIVIEEDDEIAGVFIYNLPALPEFSNLLFSKFEFLAINKKYRNKGMGKRLFESAILSSINDGADIIDSTLVDKNIISQSIHEKYNFRLINTFYTFHKWF